MVILEPGQDGKLAVIVMAAVLGHASVALERVTARALSVEGSHAKESVLRWQTAPETGHGRHGRHGLLAAPAVGSVSRSDSVPAATPLPAMGDAFVWARIVKRDTAMSTCPAPHMSIGQHGLHGSAAQFHAAVGSSRDDECVRTETNALDAALNSSPVIPSLAQI